MDNSTEQVSTNLSSLSLLLNQTTYTLWLTVPPVLLVLGCFGNVMTIVVMRAMRASESTACLSVYFTALALSDLCLNVSFMVAEWPEIALNVPVKHSHDVTCAVSFFLFFGTSMTSAWLLMAMTCQRMMSVIVPHRVDVFCTVKRAKIVSVVLALLACTACAYILFNYRVRGFGGDRYKCQNIDGETGDLYLLLVLIISSLIPFSFLLVANTVLIRAVLQSLNFSRSAMARTRKQQPSTTTTTTTTHNPPSAKVSSMTVTLILTSVAFFLLTSPICVSDVYMQEVGFYQGRIRDGDVLATLTLVETVALMLGMSNSVVNFYLYVLSGRKFREETKRHLCLLFHIQ